MAILSDAVMAAMERVPRHQFVPPENADSAYANRPQPIGFGQTISQPYMVAVMTELLHIKPGDRVLEIGTGCGYQAAVLAEIAGTVYSVEKVTELADRARRRLQKMGYENVHIKTGDGYQGWPEQAPFDAIIVTAAPLDIPVNLIEQLKIGGRMVIPVGDVFSRQVLKVGIKRADGAIDFTSTLPVAFVPLVKGA
ncbi:MAG: protein-L-isoaspartate(D-aspartate) O-methyltransferase [Alphaproteobacteria bacterium]